MGVLPKLLLRPALPWRRTLDGSHAPGTARKQPFLPSQGTGTSATWTPRTASHGAARTRHPFRSRHLGGSRGALGRAMAYRCKVAVYGGPGGVARHLGGPALQPDPAAGS